MSCGIIDFVCLLVCFLVSLQHLCGECRKQGGQFVSVMKYLGDLEEGGNKI